MITGYSDNFNRTVASGFGTSSSGHVYSVNGTATQYNVTPSTATIVPSALGERYGWVDRQTADIDIAGQVALSAIPASNLMTVGFIVKRLDASNYYNATMMVATGGAISLRFSRVVAGSLFTLASQTTGLTYVANAVYNLRVVAFWSDALQVNVIRSKLWAAGAAEPGGWMLVATDNTLTQYTTGTGAGILSRDEATVPGAVTAKIQNVVTKTYGLPIPATTDTVCADPAVAFPKQTALKSLADAADVAMTALDPRVSLAGLFPRVRVSRSDWSLNTAAAFPTSTYNATEFNIGTTTNLGYNNQVISLPQGIWLVTYELELQGGSPATDMSVQVSSASSSNSSPPIYMRISPTNVNDNGHGGAGRAAALVYSTDAAASVNVSASLSTGAAGVYTVKYSALSAIKISDYFV